MYDLNCGKNALPGGRIIFLSSLDNHLFTHNIVSERVNTSELVIIIITLC